MTINEWTAGGAKTDTATAGVAYDFSTILEDGEEVLWVTCPKAAGAGNFIYLNSEYVKVTSGQIDTTYVFSPTATFDTAGTYKASVTTTTYKTYLLTLTVAEAGV